MSSMTLVTWAPGLAGCQRPFSPHEHVWVPLADLGGDILHILLADSAMHNPQSLWHSLWECDVWHHEEKKKKKRKKAQKKPCKKPKPLSVLLRDVQKQMPPLWSRTGAISSLLADQRGLVIDGILQESRFWWVPATWIKKELLKRRCERGEKWRKKKQTKQGKINSKTAAVVGLFGAKLQWATECLEAAWTIVNSVFRNCFSCSTS